MGAARRWEAGKLGGWNARRCAPQEIKKGEERLLYPLLSFFAYSLVNRNGFPGFRSTEF
jgi:hypothetical protein